MTTAHTSEKQIEKLCEEIRHHEYLYYALDSPEITALTSVIDPLAVTPAPPPNRRLIVGAWHDRMAMREPAIALQERWGGQLYWYDGSHVGHIFSRRVQRVTDRFLGDVAAEKEDDPVPG